MQNDLTLEAYNYELPEELIAQHPADKRDNSRLMIVDGTQNDIQHKRFTDIADLIAAEDIVVINDTKVFPARLYGKKETGGKVEVFLLEFPSIDNNLPGTATAPALIRSSKRPKPGSRLIIDDALSCRVEKEIGEGKVLLLLQYDPNRNLHEILSGCGQIPLPPYIGRKQGSTDKDVQRYQTVYANQPGAVAAPTAGLHFTNTLLEKIKDRGTQFASVTLHVGYGTFAPVRETDITRHQIHSEHLTITQETVDAIHGAKARGGKVWAVGTTTVRSLEFGARKSGKLEAVEDWCDLYIYPGFTFKVIDNLITNFHLPDSSLMFLVSALCGRTTLLNCYKTAIAEGYRFFSYGDAMAVINQRPGISTLS